MKRFLVPFMTRARPATRHDRGVVSHDSRSKTDWEGDNDATDDLGYSAQRIDPDARP